ncbi:MAG: hypothetical protein ACREUM_02850, partial [Nitrosospira sp.]
FIESVLFIRAIAGEGLPSLCSNSTKFSPCILDRFKINRVNIVPKRTVAATTKINKAFVKHIAA